MIEFGNKNALGDISRTIVTYVEIGKTLEDGSQKSQWTVPIFLQYCSTYEVTL